MRRVWALALGIVIALTVVAVIGPLGGATTMLTASLPVGGGVAAAYLMGTDHRVARGMFLLVGILLGALGFVLGAAAFPDTQMGLYLGGVVPTLLIALAAMWTKRQSDFLCGMIGAGALTGVYATRFNTDPQALNYLLPIAIGQALLPLAMGFLTGILVQAFVATDLEQEAVDEAEQITQEESEEAGPASSDDVEVTS
jgi:hypothetical protein